MCSAGNDVVWLVQTQSIHNRIVLLESLSFGILRSRFWKGWPRINFHTIKAVKMKGFVYGWCAIKPASSDPWPTVIDSDFCGTSPMPQVKLGAKRQVGAGTFHGFGIIAFARACVVVVLWNGAVTWKID